MKGLVVVEPVGRLGDSVSFSEFVSGSFGRPEVPDVGEFAKRLARDLVVDVSSVEAGVERLGRGGERLGSEGVSRRSFGDLLSGAGLVGLGVLGSVPGVPGGLGRLDDVGDVVRTADVAKDVARGAEAAGDVARGRKVVNPDIELAGEGVVPARLRSDVSPKDVSYRILHTAPTSDGGGPMHDLTQIYPDDIYGPDARRLYGDYQYLDDVDVESEAWVAVEGARGNPNALVNIYRAVPETAPDEILLGDWVTLSRSYAEIEAGRIVSVPHKILNAQVPAKHLYTNGDSIMEWGYDPRAAGDVARGAEASRITMTERAMPVEPQTGKSILDDATPGLADGEAVIRGIDEAFRARGQDSLWVPGERIDLEAPGISIGRVSDYDTPYFLNDIKSAGYRPWKEAVDIIKQLQRDVVALDRSYYSVDNRKMLELFEEAADLNDWQPVPAPLMYDPTNSYSGSWFDSPDADALNAFVQSLYYRARSQVWANNALVQQRMLRSISEIDEAQRARELISIEKARFSSISDLMRDANPIIQTDAYLFDSRITRDGFRNQFFTGTSRGDLDFYNRVVAESAMLGIPPHLGATHRPVYGYIGRIPARGSADIGADFTPRLINSPESIAAFARHMMSPNQAWIEQYGDIGVVFDRSKLSDSTFTLGDSLGAASQGKVVASNAGNITPDSLLTAIAEPLSPSSRSVVARYFEWQYVNPSLDDIVAIYMKNDGPYRTVLNALRRAGLSDVEIIVGAR